MPATDDALWFGEVDDKHNTIYAQFKGIDPNEHRIEINVREAVFYPETTGINYITVRGFTMEHAAPNWMPPTAGQVGLIGTHWSRGWIIEDNVIRFVVQDIEAGTGRTTWKHLKSVLNALNLELEPKGPLVDAWRAQRKASE